MRDGDPAWDERLDHVPRDVYHAAGYHSFARESGEGEPYLIVVGDRRRGFAWPYLLRQISELGDSAALGLHDVTSVYGYPGPVAWGCGSGDTFLARAWSEVLSIWREQGVVSAFTRFHPILGNASLVPAWQGPGEPQTVAPIGRTVSIDISILEKARSDYWSGTRRQLNVSRRAGLKTTHDEGWTDLGEFARLYRETMIRNHAAQYYFFDVPDFERLRAAIPGRVHLLVTRKDDVVAAAGLFTECAGIVETHLVATNAALARVSPYKTLIDDTASWACGRGNRVFHLGGGLGAREDSLFDFKRQFSARRHLFYTGRWILDREACRYLLEARLAAKSDGPLDPDYFPPYRAPALDRGRREATATT